MSHSVVPTRRQPGSRGHSGELIPVRTRKAWQMLRQTGILVRDCSASMSGQKKLDAEAACADLLHILSTCANNSAFDLAVVDFSGHAAIVNAIQPVTAVKLPPMQIDSSTDIAAGLLATESLLSQFGNDQIRPVILLFTDGCHNGTEDPRYVAERLKSRATIVTVAFGDDADESLLQELAMSPQHSYRCSDGYSLRCFFAEFGTTMSESIQFGIDGNDAFAALDEGSR
ncbi:MAG: VWA domain-containing protein [Planctomyces sp.]|nr:VWA domain-containing protein [Planctomyces sp.]